MNWFRYFSSQFLLSQKVYWRDLGFSLTGALLPLGLGIALPLSQHDEGKIGGFDGGVYLLPGVVGFAVLWILYNIINSAASRRDKLIYKRLRGTPLPDTAILTGEAASGSVTTVLQAIVLFIVGAFTLDAPAPQNPLLVVVGIVLGVATFSLLAIGLSGLLPSGEVSTWIVTPLIMLMMLVSGIIMPISSLPSWSQDAVQFLPSSPVVEIIRTGYLGHDFASDPASTSIPAAVGVVGGFKACAMPLGLLCAWIGFSFSMGKRFFRWDPRRSS